MQRSNFHFTLAPEMQFSKSIYFLFGLTLAALLGILTWNGYYLYQFEKKRLKDEIDMIVKESSGILFHKNVSLLNNMAIMMSDKQYQEKMAFAAGFTQNMTSIGVYFDEDTVKENEKAKDAIKINKEFLKERNINYDTTFVKRLSDFDSIFHYRLDSLGLDITYTIKKLDRFDSTVAKGYVASTPFMINPVDPKMYRLTYKPSNRVILLRLTPFVGSGFLLVILVVSGFVFYRRSYRMQAQISEFKQSLFSNVTHELKTPVSSLQLILDEAARHSNGRQAIISDEHIQFARTEIDRIKLNIDKILSFGKLNREQFEIDKELLDLNDIVKEAISVTSVLLSEKSGTIIYKEAKGANVLGDRTLLLNVIATLIDNAVKYNRNRPVIDIKIERRQTNACITISDNGIGIAEMFYGKIFEPFFRVPTGDRHDIKGHGLGLSFVSQVMALHKGSVSVISEEGKGSSFSIIIPIV